MRELSSTLSRVRPELFVGNMAKISSNSPNAKYWQFRKLLFIHHQKTTDQIESNPFKLQKSFKQIHPQKILKAQGLVLDKQSTSQ